MMQQTKRHKQDRARTFSLWLPGCGAFTVRAVMGKQQIASLFYFSPIKANLFPPLFPVFFFFSCLFFLSFFQGSFNNDAVSERL
jgi:hypothetical protein